MDPFKIQKPKPEVYPFPKGVRDFSKIGWMRSGPMQKRKMTACQKLQSQTNGERSDTHNFAFAKSTLRNNFHL